MNSRWLNIRKDEFAVLMALLGSRSLYGFEFTAGRIISKNEINRVLADLYQDGVIDFSGSNVLINEAHKILFETVRDASKCVIATEIKNMNKKTVSYISRSNVVVMEGDRLDEQRIRLTLSDKESWPHYLVKACMGYVKCDNMMSSQMDLEESDLNSKTVESESVVSFQYSDAAKGECIEECEVREKGTDSFVLYYPKGGSESRILTGKAESVESILKMWGDLKDDNDSGIFTCCGPEL